MEEEDQYKHKYPIGSENHRDIHEFPAHLHSFKSKNKGYSADEVKGIEKRKYNFIETSKGKLCPCNHCTKIFRLASSRSSHIRRVHQNRRPHKCDTCGCAFHIPSKLIAHMKTHTGEKQCKCHMCNESFTRAKYLKHLVQTHNNPKEKAEKGNLVLTDDEQKLHKCLVSSDNVQDGNALGSHLLSSKPETKRGSGGIKKKLDTRFNVIETPEGKLYPCRYCKKVLTSSNTRSIHTRSVHDESKPHKCDICGRGFFRPNCLIAHMRTHTGERPHKCQLCGMEFTLPASLKLHVQRHQNPKLKKKREGGNVVFFENGQKRYKCAVCSMIFRSRSSVSMHVKRKHKVCQPQECNFCGHSFSQKFFLELHVRRIHSKQKYRCRFCRKSFSNDLTLRSPLRSHGEELYICSACSYSTFAEEAFRKHEKTHGEGALGYTGVKVQLKLSPEITLL